MKAKKLITLCLVGAMALSSIATTSVFATNNGTGTTTVTYNPNAGGPGPVDPTDPDNDTNNWLVYYPSKVALTSNHVNSSLATSAANSMEMQFKGERQIADSITGSKVLSDKIVAHGITVAANTADDNDWTGEIIKMTNKNDQDVSNVEMGIKASKTVSKAGGLAQKNGFMAALKSDNTEAYTDKVNVAVTKNDGVKEGQHYIAKLIYTFTNSTEAIVAK